MTPNILVFVTNVLLFDTNVFVFAPFVLVFTPFVCVFRFCYAELWDTRFALLWNICFLILIRLAMAVYLQGVRYFLVLLWVYAALSKLFTFEEFQLQLAQSPLLSAYAVPISYAVILAELGIALLLCVRRSLLAGLYLSFGLMTAFAVYIYLILNYSDFVPCSCGGILEKMGWTEHLWFNIVVCLLIVLAIIFTDTSKKRVLIVSSVLLVGSVGMVIALFLSSEYIIKKENPFVRRFLPHPILNAKYLDLKTNSYYIAGLTKDTLYLGNYTAPLLITAIPTNFESAVEHVIILNETQRLFRNLNVRILDDVFFVSDGTIPIIYKGKIRDWKANQFMEEPIYFSLLQPISKNSFIFRSQRASSGEHILGNLTVHDSLTFELYNNALQKQRDGVFDTDGQLIVDSKKGQGVYTYYYRNQYLVYQPKENDFIKGKTIDTVSIAKIQVAKLKSGERKMSAPPYKVNSKTYAYNGLLYIKSALLGKNEPKKMWKQASVIDVYDYNKNEYLYSFYVYDHQKEKVREFALSDIYFFAIAGNTLIRYQRVNN